MTTNKNLEIKHIPLPDNPFEFGSMAYLIFEASKVPDILYLIAPDTMSNDSCLKIVCRPEYNIDSIFRFVDEHLPIHLTSEVIVENP